MKSTAEEKRKNKRYYCTVPVDGKEGSTFDQTRTVDISRHGIGFISQSAIPLNEKIAVEIAVAPEAEPVLVMGVVKWVRKISDCDQYRIGMIFSEVISGSAASLNKYLRAGFSDGVK